MIHRRGFLGRMLAAVVAPFVPVPQAAPSPPLFFHKDAFALTMQPLTYLDQLEASLRYESGLIEDLMPKVYAVNGLKNYHV